MICTLMKSYFFFFNDTATTEIYTLSLHDALPILIRPEPTCTGTLVEIVVGVAELTVVILVLNLTRSLIRSEEHTSELQSRLHLVCRLLLEKKKKEHRSVSLLQIHEFR